MSDLKNHAIFEGPLLKIQRAKQHVADLDIHITEYLENDPFVLKVRQGLNPPQRLIYVEASHPMPTGLSLIIGDAVHNLRTALDHLCFAMVGTKTKKPRNVGFPFAKGKQSLGGAIATRQMHLAPPRVQKELHALEPYPGGNKYLQAVKALDERDKHHFILTVGVGIEMTGAQFGTLVGPSNVPALGSGERIATVGDFCMALDPTATIEIFDKEAEFQPAFTIGFGQEEELASEPVIPSLIHMVNETERAVHRLISVLAE